MRHFFTTLAIMFITLSNMAQECIQIKNENGVYTVPCLVNGLKLRFVFDTGAADVSISATEALFMLKNEYLSEDDFIDKASYILADGSIQENAIVNLKEIKIGSKTLNDIRACVVNNIEAPLLLGQSAIKRLGAWYIDEDKLFLDENFKSISSDSIAEKTPIEKCIEEAKRYESYGDYDTAIALFQKACSIKNHENYLAFANFCYKHRDEYEDCIKYIPFDKITHAAMDGYQPIIDFLKKWPSLFNYAGKNALRYYLDLISNGEYWFLCKSASQFCLWTLKNRVKGLEIVLLGAEHNDPESLSYLAHLHSPECESDDERNLVTQDVDTAIKLYKKSIELGNTNILRDCAVLLLEKREVKGNYELAISYLKKAGELGDKLAMMDLMDEYCYTKPENFEKALYWGQKIIKDPESIVYNYAMSMVGTIYFKQEKNEEAFNCLKIAHTNQKKFGVRRAPTRFSMLLLAECYYYGLGTSKDYALAYKYYLEYIEKGEDVGTDNTIYAYNRLAYLYDNGLGVIENANKAFDCYMKAANYGDAFAESMVANAYFEGEGTNKDIDKAIFWFNKSAQQNHAYSWYSLGFIYSREVFGKHNVIKAVDCFNKAIECDNEDSASYYELGRIYEIGGEGVSISYTKAGNYYKKAAELGHERAKEKMKEFQ